MNYFSWWDSTKDLVIEGQSWESEILPDFISLLIFIKIQVIIRNRWSMERSDTANVTPQVLFFCILQPRFSMWPFKVMHVTKSHAQRRLCGLWHISILYMIILIHLFLIVYEYECLQQDIMAERRYNWWEKNTVAYYIGSIQDLCKSFSLFKFDMN